MYYKRKTYLEVADFSPTVIIRATEMKWRKYMYCVFCFECACVSGGDVGALWSGGPTNSALSRSRSCGQLWLVADLLQGQGMPKWCCHVHMLTNIFGLPLARVPIQNFWGHKTLPLGRFHWGGGAARARMLKFHLEIVIFSACLARIVYLNS